MRYRVTFSIPAYIDDARDFCAVRTEPFIDIRNARVIALGMKKAGFTSVYIEREEAEYWKEVVEERVLIDGYP